LSRRNFAASAARDVAEGSCLVRLGLERQVAGHAAQGQPQRMAEMAQDPQRPALVVGDVPAFQLERVGLFAHRLDVDAVPARRIGDGAASSAVRPKVSRASWSISGNWARASGSANDGFISARVSRSAKPGRSIRRRGAIS
jgi:hypothetical protein